MLILRCCQPIVIFLFFAILTFVVRLTLLIVTVITWAVWRYAGIAFQAVSMLR